jgi:pimeloyl-ACP methyl ester carboxylesterase
VKPGGPSWGHRCAAAAVAALVGGVVGGCAVGSTPSQSASSSGVSTDPSSASPAPHATATAPTVVPATAASSASASGRPARPTFTGIVQADGVRQWLHCAGNGPVTVVVVPGLQSTASDWSEVRPAFEKLTRTCVYDRPGLGLSPARTDGRRVLDAGRYAQELGALLAAAGEPGPYLVIGHSFGGLVARAFVRTHLADVAAVFLAESVTPGDPYLGSTWREAGLHIDMAASSRATGGGPRMGSVPLLVMTASRADADHLHGPSYGQAAAVTAQWLAGQRDDLRLSSDAIQVVAMSGHVLQQDAPAPVVEAVRELLVATTTGARLRCSAVWKTWGASCRV